MCHTRAWKLWQTALGPIAAKDRMNCKLAQPRRPISFVATTDPDKARAFYSEVLALKLRETSPFALVFDDGEHTFRVQIVTELTPASHTVHGWEVSNIEKEIAHLVSKGVTFLTFDHLCQNASAVWTSPDGHEIAWFKDPCGNILSLTQHATP